MKRREFIAALGSAAVWPSVVSAQQGEQIRPVGVLTSGLDIPNSIVRLFRDDLEQLGWTEGRNLRLDLRFGKGEAAQTRAFAADLVRSAPDVIVAVYLTALRAVQRGRRRFRPYSLGVATSSKTEP